MTSMAAPLQCPMAPRRKAKPTIESNKPALAAMLLMNHKAPCLWDDDDDDDDDDESDSDDATSFTASTSVFSEQESQENLVCGMIRRLDMAFEEDEEEGWARITGHSTASNNSRHFSNSVSSHSSSNSSCASAESVETPLPLPLPFPPPRRRNSIVAVPSPFIVQRCYSSDSSDMLFPSRH